MNEIEQLLNQIILANIKLKIIEKYGTSISDDDFNEISEDAYNNTYNKQYDILVNQFQLDSNKEFSNEEIQNIIKNLKELLSQINVKIPRKITITKK